MAYGVDDFAGVDLSAAFTEGLAVQLRRHLDKGPYQEDLTFAYWRPSRGTNRFTAVLHGLALPRNGDRILQGNVAFTGQYFRRVLEELPEGSGVALLHGHLGPGWQGMSGEDMVAEKDRLASAVAGRTGLPVVGLTQGSDGAWSARFWLREGRLAYRRKWARTVRTVGSRLWVTYHPDDTAPAPTSAQVATLSVWGEAAQADLVRARIGIVGLGSVGSIVAEALCRLGLRRLTFIDFDLLEMRNLDRTLGATAADLAADLLKVQVAARSAALTHTADDLDLTVVPRSLLTPEALGAALDCDVLISCVDRPWPRFLLNTIAFAHLIPVVDGGIMARVKPDGTPLHIDWRIHTITPGRACLVCLDALRRGDVALDMDGQLDNPDYIKGLSEEDRARFSRRNVFPFSLSVAAHQVLQLVGLVTGSARIGGIGPQVYHAYPGEMKVLDVACDEDCEFVALTATAADLSHNLAP